MKKLSRQEIETKVNEVLVDKLGVSESEVRPEAKLEDDFVADSLDAVVIVMELEREFGISISDEELDGVTSCKVSDVYDLVERLQK